jgi:hypothetical protein
VPGLLLDRQEPFFLPELESGVCASLIYGIEAVLFLEIWKFDKVDD